MAQANRQPTALENHAQTILISVCTAALLFAAKFIYDMNRTTGELALKLELLSVQTKSLELKLDEMSQNYVRQTDFRDLEQRVRILEIRKK